ncbi:MAG: caspase family protein [Desulfobacterales bacterium]|jgi:hypothetical protein|nr:caspase family protein [Desulfobacterales bacterium]
MNRNRRFSLCRCLAAMMIVAVAPVAPGGAVTIHTWEDYTRPFGARLAGITRESPGVIVLTLPADVVATRRVTLTLSTTASGGHATYGARVLLLVNGNPLPALLMGPGLRVDLDPRHLQPGVNALRFVGFNDTYRIDVYDLRIETAAAAPGREAAPAQAKAVERPPAPPAAPPSQVDPRPTAPAPPSTPAPAPAPPAARAEAPKPVPATPPPAAKSPPPMQPPAPALPPAPVPAETDPGQRWAVVIGVSDYEDSRIPSLRYAARDAQVFHDWLVSPTGGRYAPSKVKLLLNRNATNERIKDALFNWLKQAIEEDVVVIYFAGHGSPESPEAVQNLFLLPTNARYDNIAVTGFPMWDVETALKRFIKARRVVIIADACHAAGVGQSFDVAVRADRGLQVNQISAGLQGLSDVGEGVCVISASRDREFSQESREWGGGHGVFTHYLLEGLKGAADFDRSGSVSVGEVTVYVSQQVRRATRNAQNPVVAGRFDPSLVIGK